MSNGNTPRGGRVRGTPLANNLPSVRPGGLAGSNINMLDFIPIFHGEEGKGPKIGEFLEILTEIATESEWSNMVIKHVLRSKLAGQALHFFMNNPTIRTCSNIREYGKVMREKFSRSKSDQSGLWEFLSCCQSKGESVSDFAIRLSSLRESINKPSSNPDANHVGSEMMYKVFYEGLHMNIQEKLLAFDIDDFRTCMEAAERVEKRINSLASRTKNILASRGMCDRDHYGEIDEASSEIEHSDDTSELDGVSNRVSCIQLESQHTNKDAAYTQCGRVKGRSWDLQKPSPDKGGPSKSTKDETDSCPKPRYFDSSSRTEKYKKANSAGNKLLVGLKVGRSSFKALVDSASDISLVAIETLDYLKLNKHIYRGKMINVTGTNHGTISSGEYIDLRFKYDTAQDTFCHSFVVVQSKQILGFKAILGSDYLSANEGVIDLSKGNLSLYGTIVAKLDRVMVDDTSLAALISKPVTTSGKKTDGGNGVSVERGDWESDRNHKCQENERKDTPKINVQNIKPKDGEDFKPYPDGAMKAVLNYSKKYGTEEIIEIDRDKEKRKMLKGLVTHLSNNHGLMEDTYDLLLKYEGSFAMDTLEVGTIKGWDHKVTLESNTPVRIKQFAIAESLKGKLASKLCTYLKSDIIEPSTSEWNLPIIVKSKKNGGIRLVLDAKAVNSITRKVDYPMVDLKTIFARLGGFTYFSILDMESGYHQVLLEQESRKFFAFRTPWGKFQFKRLPMGATNSGLHFQKVMEDVLSDMAGEGIFIFQDDVLIATHTVEEHLSLLEKVLDAFHRRGVTIKIGKCGLIKYKVRFLGHDISSEGFTLSPENVISILNAKRPHNKTTIRSFLGKIRFYSRFIPDLTRKIQNIQVLLRGKGERIRWTEEASKDFEEIKKWVSGYPRLKYPNYANPFILTVAHSSDSIAATLEQEGEDGLFPVGFYSRLLRNAETRYSSIEKESLAIVDALNHFSHIVYGFQTKIQSSHSSLEYLRSLKEGNSRITKWITRMLDNSPEFVKKGKIEDGINEIMLNKEGESSEVKENLNNEREVEKIIEDNTEELPVIYTDGSCRRNGKVGASAGIGYFSDAGSKMEVSGAIDGKQSNNRAELLAAIMALEEAIQKKMPKVILRSDSKYLIDNVKENLVRWEKGGYLNHKGKPIINIVEFKKLSELLMKIDVIWEHVKAHCGILGNEKADYLANRGNVLTDPNNFMLCAYEDIGLRPDVKMERITKETQMIDPNLEEDPVEGGIHLEEHIICPEKEAYVDNNNRGWDDEMKSIEGIKKNEISACAIRTQQSPYSRPVCRDTIRQAQDNDEEISKIKGEIDSSRIESWDEWGIRLYLDSDGLVCARGVISISKKETFSIDALYVPKDLRHRLLKQEHESHWAIHPQYFQLCRATLSKYFWPTFRSDTRKFVEGCIECQKGREVRTKTAILDFEKPTVPWEMVAADVIGPIFKSSNNMEYILTIIDIFTRHITLIPMSDQTKESVIEAMEKIYLPRFGSPKTILTDNGANFTSRLFESICNVLGITHKCTPPYHPQGNGLVERSNREIKKKLTFLCEGASLQWDRKLAYVEFAYNNTYNSSIGASPNQVLFGRNMRVPDNSECETNTGEVLATSDYIDRFRDRLQTIWKSTAEWEKGAREKRNKLKNKKRNIKVFEIGEEVLYRKIKSKGNRREGFTYKYEGPFIVTDKISEVTYRIKDPNASPDHFIRAHTDRLKQLVKFDGLPETKERVKTKKKIAVSYQEENDPSEVVNGEITNSDGVERLDANESNEGTDDNDSNEAPSQDNANDKCQEEKLISDDNNSRASVNGHFTRSKGAINRLDYTKYEFDRAGRITIRGKK